MRPAHAADTPAIRAFLLDHAPTAMFPLSNLARFGTSGDHPRVVSFWLAEQGGRITDVLTVSNEGMVFPQCNSGDWNAVAQALGGVGIKGVIGDAKQVAAFSKTAGFGTPDGLDMCEPHYQLSLKDIIMPDTQNHDLIPLAAIPVSQAIGWREAFCEEALNFPTGTARQKATDDINSFVAQGTHRVLTMNGEPVAMTGFNAVLPDIVQVGGVYTPPQNRGQGFARRAVAMHLSQAGAPQSVLSAATPSAARAYEAIGYRQIGEFAFAVWSEKQVIHG